MSLHKLLQLWQQPTQGDQAILPQRVLEHLVMTTGARGGRLHLGSHVVTEVGFLEPPIMMHSLPAGREPFELALAGGEPPGEELLLAAGTVLAAWSLREELRASRFAERRRRWEAQSLRTLGEVLRGQLDAKAVSQYLLFHSLALLDARRGELWLAGDLCGDGEATREVKGQLCLGERLGDPVLSPQQAATVAASHLFSPHLVAVPISDRERTFGVLAVADREVRKGFAPFSPEDVETLSLFAAQGALAFSAILAYRQRVAQERLERELTLAASVQQHLLPRLPARFSGWELVGLSVPTRHVGGDLYDFLPLDDGALLALFDVSGKGAPAALLAASLQGALRVAVKHARNLCELARILDEHLATLWAEHQFATAFFFRLREDGTVHYLGAGHTPALVVTAHGASQLVYPQGPPLGLLPNARYEESTLALGGGDTLVVTTDGVAEATNPTGEEYGLARLRTLVTAHRGERLNHLAGSLLESVRGFQAGETATDDMTFLLLRRSI